MKRKFGKINIIDALVAAILFLILLMFVFALKSSNAISGKRTLVTMHIVDPELSKLVYPEAVKLGKVYLNSVNVPVEMVGIDKEIDASGRVKTLDITVAGKGEIVEGKYIFNGSRILVGQKAEIHGTYWAQGFIKEVRYAN